MGRTNSKKEILSCGFQGERTGAGFIQLVTNLVFTILFAALIIIFYPGADETKCSEAIFHGKRLIYCQEFSLCTILFYFALAITIISCLILSSHDLVIGIKEKKAKLLFSWLLYLSGYWFANFLLIYTLSGGLNIFYCTVYLGFCSIPPVLVVCSLVDEIEELEQESRERLFKEVFVS